MNGKKSSDTSDSDEESSDDEPATKHDAKTTEGSSTAPQKKRKNSDADEPVAKKAKNEPAATNPKTLWVANLSWNVDDEWLGREFGAMNGLKGARVITMADSGKSRGFGYVDFETAEDSANALDAMKGVTVDDRELRLDFAPDRADKQASGRERQEKREQGFGDVKSAPSDSLWVGSLSFSSTQQSVQEAFSPYGPLTRVHLPTDQETGQLRGFGYVGFESIDAATEALEGMKGAAIDGRPIRLDFAPPRQNDGGRGGGRGGRGGRGDFRGGRGDFRGGRGGGFRGDRGGRGGRGDSRGRGMSTNRGMCLSPFRLSRIAS